MPGNAQQRITDTLNYLQFTGIGPAGARGPAHQLAQAYIAARFPGGPASPGYQAFSNQLSLGHHWGGDPQQYRRKKRALFPVSYTHLTLPTNREV